MAETGPAVFGQNHPDLDIVANFGPDILAGVPVGTVVGIAVGFVKCTAVDIVGFAGLGIHNLAVSRTG